MAKRRGLVQVSGQGKEITMEWLSQNWMWLLLAVGVVFLLSRTRQGGAMGCCSAHDMAHEAPAGESKPQGVNATRPPVKEGKMG